MSPSIEVIPEQLPSDWRKVVRVGAFVVLLGMAGFVVGVAAAETTVGRRLAEHAQGQADLPSVLRQMNKKLDALCRATPTAQCPLGEKDE